MLHRTKSNQQYHLTSREIRRESSLWYDGPNGQTRNDSDRGVHYKALEAMQPALKAMVCVLMSAPWKRQFWGSLWGSAGRREAKIRTPTRKYSQKNAKIPRNTARNRLLTGSKLKAALQVARGLVGATPGSKTGRFGSNAISSRSESRLIQESEVNGIK